MCALGEIYLGVEGSSEENKQSAKILKSFVESASRDIHAKGVLVYFFRGGKKMIG